MWTNVVVIHSKAQIFSGIGYHSLSHSNSNIKERKNRLRIGYLFHMGITTGEGRMAVAADLLTC